MRSRGSLASMGSWAIPPCVDWTRLYRYPHATRDGIAPKALTVYGDLRTLGVCDPALTPESDRAELERLAATSPQWASATGFMRVKARPERVARSKSIARTPTPRAIAALTRHESEIATALDALPHGTGARHSARMAVAAELLRRGYPRDAVEAVLRAIASALGKDPATVVSETVSTSVDRIARGEPHRAGGYLRREAPQVWTALRALPRELVSVALDRSRELSRDEASELVSATLDRVRASRGIAVIRATPGAGKTYTSARVACDNAARGAPTLLLAPTHAIARDLVRACAERGVMADHLTGPLSHRDEAGETSCRLAESAQSAARAGRLVTLTVCDGVGFGQAPQVSEARPSHSPCPHRTGCEAYEGARAESTALVIVTVHALAGKGLDALERRARADGAGAPLIVIDESPDILHTQSLTVATLERASAALLSAGFARSAALTAIVCEALARAIPLATVEHVSLTSLLELVLSPGELAHVRESATANNGRARTQFAPRLSARAVATIHRGRALQQTTQRAGEMGEALTRLLALETRGSPAPHVSVAPRGHGADPDELELLVTLPRAELHAVLLAPYGRAVLDATVDTRVLAALACVEVETVAVDVRDRSQVDRALLHCADATRGDMVPRGAVAWDVVERPLREAIALALERTPGGEALALITYQPLAIALESAWSGEALDPRAVDLVAPIREAGCILLTGYYGNVRGRNDWTNARALIAFGTPWPNRGAVERLAYELALTDSLPEVWEHLARAELEQACGRLRAPQRETPAYLLVVSTVAPLSFDSRWSALELSQGRDRAHDPAELVRLARETNIATAATIAGVSTDTVSRAVKAARTATATSCETSHARVVPPDTASAVIYARFTRALELMRDRERIISSDPAERDARDPAISQAINRRERST